MQRFLDWWQRGLIIALGFSVALLGVGRVEFFPGASFSSWSVSRTTFFFWLLFKVVVGFRSGWAATDLRRLGALGPLYAFAAAVTISLFPDLRLTGDYRYFLLGCVHTMMVVDLFPRTRYKRLLPLLCGLVPVVAVARGLIEKPAVFDFVLAQRFGFPLDHANTAGYVFAMSVPLAFAVAMAGSLVWRSAGALSFLSQSGALVLTYSRGAWLACGAALLFLMAATRKWKALAALTALAGVLLLLVPSLRDRLVSLGSPGEDTSLSERSHLLTAAVRLGLDHPVLGVGYGRGRLKEALRPYLRGSPVQDRPIWHAHNVYAEILAGTGLLGLIAFLWLLGSVLLRNILTTWKQAGTARVLGLGLTASWIAAIIGGLGDVPFYHHETRIFFFTLIGAADLYSRSGAQEPAP